MKLRPKSIAPLVMLAGTAIACWAVEAAGIRLNLTPSVPIGLYRLSRSPEQVGDLVAACLPESSGALGRERGYLRRGSCPAAASPIIKRVAAVSGDLVEVRAGGVFQQGRRFQDPAPSVDSHGRALAPVAIGSYPLSSGQLWLFSPHENSWDSRFYGPIPVGSVLGTVIPLWTWGQSTERNHRMVRPTRVRSLDQ